MRDRGVQWLPEYDLSSGMGKMYLDVHHKKT